MIALKCIALVLLFSGCAQNKVLFQEDLHELKKNNLIRFNSATNSLGLEVTYQGSDIGSDRIVQEFRLNEKVMEASLLFDVYFDSDFQFVKGGKLHGVGPDMPITGGGDVRPSGWSSRIMFNVDGKISSYVYHQRLKGRYGDSKINERFKFQKKKWYKITLYTRLNSAKTNTNGEVRIYIDGELIISHQNILFWKDDLNSAMISKFLFSTFHGGHDKSWAPKDELGHYTKSHAQFKNFEVMEGLKINN